MTVHPGRMRRRQHPRRLFDVGQVRIAVGQGRGDVDDGDVERGAVLGVIARAVPTARQRGLNHRVGDVLDVRPSVRQSLDAIVVVVKAHDVESRLDRPHGEGQPDVALADDDNLVAAPTAVPGT